MDIIIQIKAGEGVPEGDLQVLVCLLFGESSFFNASFDEILQPLKHSPEVAGDSVIIRFQCFNILC